MLGRLEQLPEYLEAKPEERSKVELQLQLKDAELSRNEGERTEVVAELCLYGTDEAIDAYEKYARANIVEIGGQGGNLGELKLALRQSIYKTHIKANEANLAIWNDPKYLTESSPEK